MIRKIVELAIPRKATARVSFSTAPNTGPLTVVTFIGRRRRQRLRSVQAGMGVTAGDWSEWIFLPPEPACKMVCRLTLSVRPGQSRETPAQVRPTTQQRTPASRRPGAHRETSIHTRDCRSVRAARARDSRYKNLKSRPGDTGRRPRLCRLAGNVAESRPQAYRTRAPAKTS